MAVAATIGSQGLSSKPREIGNARETQEQPQVGSASAAVQTSLWLQLDGVSALSGRVPLEDTSFGRHQSQRKQRAYRIQRQYTVRGLL